MNCVAFWRLATLSAAYLMATATSASVDKASVVIASVFPSQNSSSNLAGSEAGVDGLSTLDFLLDSNSASAPDVPVTALTSAADSHILFADSRWQVLEEGISHDNNTSCYSARLQRDEGLSVCVLLAVNETDQPISAAVASAVVSTLAPKCEVEDLAILQFATPVDAASMPDTASSSSSTTFIAVQDLVATGSPSSVLSNRLFVRTAQHVQINTASIEQGSSSTPLLTLELSISGERSPPSDQADGDAGSSLDSSLPTASQDSSTTNSSLIVVLLSFATFIGGCAFIFYLLCRTRYLESVDDDVAKSNKELTATLVTVLRA